MKKVVVIRNLQSPEWQSCKTISQNLISSYEEIDEKVKIIFRDLPLDNDIIASLKVAKLVKEDVPDEIVWLEYKPTPTSFLKSLSQLYEDSSQKPSLRFHIYGDFVLNVSDWASLGELLTTFPCQFLVASEKQKVLLDKLIEGSGPLVEVCPFPVNLNNFSFDQNLREAKRLELGIKEDELVILYSGRLSYQKNIYHTLYAVRDYLKLSSQKVRFIMAGPMDDLGMPYVGRSGPLGAFFGQFLTAKEALKEYFDTETFINLGNVNQGELKSLYCASDLLINLSTHNDEDYGMAPAEALCCGLPAILSSWGGFTSFKTLLPDHVGLVKLKKEKGRFLPSYKGAVKELLGFEKYDLKRRLSLSEEAGRKLSVSSISKILLTKSDSVGAFKSYSADFYRLLASFNNVPSGPFKSHNGQLNGLYFQIYSDYGGLEDE